MHKTTGFKKDFRTSNNLFVLYNLVEMQKKRTKVCYINLTEAIDYLNTDALILKLPQRNVDGKYLNLIKSMFYKVEQSS